MKELPNSQNSERAVLYAMMIDKKYIDAFKFLGNDDFYYVPHKLMFELFTKQDEKGGVVDYPFAMDAVTEEMGGIAYLTDIYKDTPSAANSMAHARIVLDCSIKRKAIAAYMNAASELHDSSIDGDQKIAEVESEINQQIARKSVGDVLTIDDLVEMSVNEMDKSSQNIRCGLKTGIREVDERLGDMYAAFGEITVIGALSKNGKTLLANTITARVELNDDEVGHIFSIEMPSVQMFNAIVSAKTGVPSNFYRKQAFYAEKYESLYSSFHAKWANGAKELHDSHRFTFDGQKEVDADYICAGMRKQAARAKARGKTLRYVVIDHLHRMNFHNSNQPLTYAIRDAVRKIKNTASDLGIAVILLAQLNNKAEGQDPTSFHILDSASVRHELQAFIGIRMFRDKGDTYFGIYGDSQRYGDMETKTHPAYMMLVGGVLSSLPQDREDWVPSMSDENNS